MTTRKPFYDEESFAKAIKLFNIGFQLQFVMDHKDEIDCISQHASDPMSIHIKITDALEGTEASKKYAEDCIPLIQSAKDMFKMADGLHTKDRFNYFMKVDAFMMEKNKVKQEVKPAEPVSSPQRSPSSVTLFAVPASQPNAEVVNLIETRPHC